MLIFTLRNTTEYRAQTLLSIISILNSLKNLFTLPWLMG